MNPEHAHFAEWDAAYVLGALSAADRRDYEDHLVECAQCRQDVAELAPTVGLLSRVSAERAETIDVAPEASTSPPGASPGPDLGLRSRIVSLSRRRSRRRRTTWAVAAAVALIAAVGVPIGIAVTAPPAPAAMSSLTDAPIEASVRLTDVAWGTRIELTCRYGGSTDADAAAGRPYALAVVGRDGSSSTVSTWLALPGATARLSAGTALPLDEVRSVEILSESSGRVLMTYDPAGP